MRVWLIHQVFGESKIVEYTITENETAPGKVEVINQPKLHQQLAFDYHVQ